MNNAVLAVENLEFIPKFVWLSFSSNILISVNNFRQKYLSKTQQMKRLFKNLLAFNP